jgi:hypothetical protein
MKARRPRAAMVGTIVCMSTGALAANDSLEAMTGSQQAQVLAKVVETSGDACTGRKAVCKGVTPHDRAVWRIDCTNGNSYLVTIEDDAKGSTRARSARFESVGDSQTA